MGDLHHTMNVHTKPPSVTGYDVGAWLGVWPSGRMVGKKGDILKLVLILVWTRLLVVMTVNLFPGYAASVHGHW